jgi:hypothetical protein
LELVFPPLGTCFSPTGLEHTEVGDLGFQLFLMRHQTATEGRLHQLITQHFAINWRQYAFGKYILKLFET